MPMYENHHGRTAAMWTGTTIVTIGFLVGTIALTIAQPWLFWVGVALIFACLVCITLPVRARSRTNPVPSTNPA